MVPPDCTVLIVEDDPLVADAIRDGAQLVGYTVCGAAWDVAGAVALTREHKPRLAIIDVDLGSGGDGLDAARQMASIGPVGIVFVTGYPDHVRRADVGHAWMPKPYRLLDLVNALAVVRAVSEGAPITAPIPPDLHLIR